ncbi:MAG TPA: type-F conjugative transfer system secretin TraK [Pseudoduganella sp.]|jgi:conjugal transfer pilus assembly protein TraK
MHKQAYRAAALLFLAAGSLDCGATQRKEARDGLAVEAVISEREVTRIRVEDAMITGIVGKIHSASGCTASAESPATAAPVPSQGSSPGAEASITCDMSKGEVYLRPLGQGKKPINLFVSTDRATYTLVMRKADVPSDTIVLFDTSMPKSTRSGDGARSRPASHVKGIKSMLKAMLTERTPNDVLAEDVNVPLQLWREASFALTRSYRGRGFLGERYRLTNTSTALMTLTEQEFDREDAGVIAVAIENFNLRPGDSTAVYVIRHEEQQ